MVHDKFVCYTCIEINVVCCVGSVQIQIEV